MRSVVRIRAGGKLTEEIEERVPVAKRSPNQVVNALSAGILRILREAGQQKYGDKRTLQRKVAGMEPAIG